MGDTEHYPEAAIRRRRDAHEDAKACKKMGLSFSDWVVDYDITRMTTDEVKAIRSLVWGGR